MQKRIGMTELQRRFWVWQAYLISRSPTFVKSRTSLVADPEILSRIWPKEKILAEYDRAVNRLAEQNANYSAEEVVADVKAAIAEVRSSRP